VVDERVEKGGVLVVAARVKSSVTFAGAVHG
jgi:hypothetical protein